MITLTFTGHLACNCELRNHEGKPYYYVRVAANATREITEFITCFINWDISKLAPYMTTGKGIYVTGKPRISKYTDREGREQLRYDVNVTDFDLFSPRTDK